MYGGGCFGVVCWIGVGLLCFWFACCVGVVVGLLCLLGCVRCLVNMCLVCAFLCFWLV